MANSSFLGNFPGIWGTLPYAAGNFTGSGSMTWDVASGEQLVTFIEIGKTMILAFVVNTSTVGGTPSQSLQIAIPNGRIVNGIKYNACQIVDDDTAAAGLIVAPNGQQFIQIRKIDESNWSAATNTTYVRGQITFQFQ